MVSGLVSLRPANAIIPIGRLSHHSQVRDDGRIWISWRNALDIGWVKKKRPFVRRCRGGVKYAFMKTAKMQLQD